MSPLFVERCPAPKGLFDEKGGLLEAVAVRAHGRPESMIGASGDGGSAGLKGKSHLSQKFIYAITRAGLCILRLKMGQKCRYQACAAGCLGQEDEATMLGGLRSTQQAASERWRGRRRVNGSTGQLGRPRGQETARSFHVEHGRVVAYTPQNNVDEA